jgi:hypothetical protein
VGAGKSKDLRRRISFTDGRADEIVRGVDFSEKLT